MNVDNLAKAISDELKNYSQEVANNLKRDTEIIARECSEELKITSPRSSKGGSKVYANGWKYKKVYENTSVIRYKVFNKNKPQLTHLLEYGHAKTNGGRVEAIPHIKIVEEKAKNKLIKKVKESVSK